MHKKSVQFIESFSTYSQIFESRDLKDYAHFGHHHPKAIQVTFGFPGFLSTHKNHFIPWIPSWDTADFSVLRPEWPYPFWTMPTPIFVNNIFPRTTTYGSLTPCWPSEKTNPPILRKLPDRKTGGQTLIHRILPVPAEGPLSWKSSYPDLKFLSS